MLEYDAPLKRLARRLRRDMTVAEHTLWFRLRRKQLDGVPCYRQKPIGPYIVDFYMPAVGLIVEVDGSQHATELGSAADRVRTTYLESVGLKVIRFDNRQVLLETEAVLEVIWSEVTCRRKEQIPPAPLFQRGESKSRPQFAAGSARAQTRRRKQ
ncbi:MAG: endonuclease domain-containing protein [Lysobacteraceae bacterium]|nr:MAG: endonuclease domain-containing protein [Xanthomonadaceae bacterium]